jgi:hypothetical protein
MSIFCTVRIDQDEKFADKCSVKALSASGLFVVGCWASISGDAECAGMGELRWNGCIQLVAD